MKKRVRIYKAPNGEGKFVNKTAQFLQKAQEGGAPDPSMMGYPGAGKQQVQQATDDQLASVILKDIGNSTPREAIVVKLVNVFGKDPNEAMMLVDQMYQYVEQQQETEVTNVSTPETVLYFSIVTLHHILLVSISELCLFETGIILSINSLT